MYTGQLYDQQPHFTNRGVPGPAGYMTHPSVSISPWPRVAIQPYMTGIAPVLPYHGTNLLISSRIQYCTSLQLPASVHPPFTLLLPPFCWLSPYKCIHFIYHLCVHRSTVLSVVWQCFSN